MNPNKKTLIFTPKPVPKKPTLVLTKKPVLNVKVPYGSLASKNPNKTA